MKRLFIIEIFKGSKMLTKKNKISKGLNKLMKRKEVSHFSNYSDVFVEHPDYRNHYMDSFSHAQLAEIANSAFK